MPGDIFSSRYLSDIQFTFFPLGTYLFQHGIHSSQHYAVNLPRRMRADRNTTHTGNADFAVNLSRIIFIDCLYRTFLSAQSAFYAIFRGLWHHPRLRRPFCTGDCPGSPGSEKSSASSFALILSAKS